MPTNARRPAGPSAGTENTAKRRAVGKKVAKAVKKAPVNRLPKMTAAEKRALNEAEELAEKRAARNAARRARAAERRAREEAERRELEKRRLVARAAAVQATKCDYIDNEEFRDRAVQKVILATPLIEEGTVARKPRRPAGLPHYLAGLYEVPLLTPKHEAALFRKMNFLKWKASELRKSLSPHRPGKKKLAECEWLLEEARITSNRIARCNLRLVVSIARKFADQGMSFDEFVSEGNMALLNAVAKFDYGRGFRFSTYATHAIRRAYYRMVQQRGRRNSRMVLGTGEIISESPHEHIERHLNEGQYSDFQRLMAKAAGELDERERLILTARFGLEESVGVQTLQVVAGQLGICKERVRQLQNRAIDKLRELAEEMHIEAPALVAPE